MTLSGRVVVSAVMFLVFAGMSVIALGYPAQARFLPLLVGVPGSVMALIQLGIDLRREQAGPGERPAGERTTAREWQLLGWLGLFLAAILAFGFLYGAPAIIVLFMRFGQKESWTTSLIGGAAAWAVIYLVFERLLELILFEGFVTEWLTG